MPFSLDENGTSKRSVVVISRVEEKLVHVGTPLTRKRTYTRLLRYGPIVSPAQCHISKGIGIFCLEEESTRLRHAVDIVDKVGDGSIHPLRRRTSLQPYTDQEKARCVPKGMQHAGPPVSAISVCKE